MDKIEKKLIINERKSNSKILLYKEGIIKFINSQTNSQIKKIINVEKINQIDYLVGILFLTEMNRYCKIANISVHGYYIAYSLIYFFIEIKQKLITNKTIKSDSVINFYSNLASNIEYYNSRLDNSHPIKKKINENFSTLILEISPLLNDIITYSKQHVLSPTNSNSNISENQEFKTSKFANLFTSEGNDTSDLNDINVHIDINNNITGCCNINCYICWVDKILTKFFYILLIIAKFMGTGTTRDPNLYKLSEYYSNFMYTMIKLDDIALKNSSNNMDKVYQILFDNYQDYKSKLIYSILELKINSDTLDEIINMLDNYIMGKFLLKNNIKYNVNF
jgi:hypothetical protein